MSEPAHEPSSPSKPPPARPLATDPGAAAESATGDEEVLAALADDFAARARRGEHPTLQQYVAKHPQLEERIRKVFPAIALIEESRSLDPAAAASGERAGSTIGRYKLLERIGEGGYGVVYMAEQHHPVRRKVALKVVKPGMDSRQVLARFEAERQALAIMDHLNIAKVFDGGMTEFGRPYFVMELVKGEPITEFCDRNQVPPRQRLELFAQVCHAVQHAHTKGVIHRDIKPTNVLVAMHDANPVVKVIDFGVAKALGQELTDKTLFTRFAQLVGTPLYMSPEQAGHSALDVDTRSDIYSLGVLLYELLTGTTPFEKDRFQKAAHDEIRRIIREEEPPRPSTRLSESKASLASVSAQRNIEPAKLTRLVRGELDWIVMKALEKDRTRRYETADGLAMDVQRYLADEPVQACPPSAAYRLRKFARRNRRTLVTSALFAAMLLAVAGSFGWMARDRSARRARTTEAVAALLDQCEDALRADQADRAALAFGAAERRIADGGGEELAGRLVRCRADLRLLSELDAIDTFRWTWARGRYPDRQAVAARWRAALTGYGMVPGKDRAGEAAERVSRSLVRERVLNALDWWLLSDPSPELRDVLRAADPDPYRDAVRNAVADRDGPALGVLAVRPEALNQPARFAAMLGELYGVLTDRARVVLESALQVRPGDLGLLMALGQSYPYNQSEGAAQRVRWFQAAVAAHPMNAAARNGLGIALLDQGDADAAVMAFREAVRLDPLSADAHNHLGNALQKRGDLDGAIAAHREAIRLDPNDAFARNSLGRALHHKGDQDGAIASFMESVRLDPNDATHHMNLANSLWMKGHVDRAIAEFRHVIRLDPTNANAHNNLASTLAEKGMAQESLAAYREAVRLAPNDARWRNNLALDLAKRGDLDGAIFQHREAIRLEPKDARWPFNLASALVKKGDVEGAIAAYRQTIRLDPKHNRAHQYLGKALFKKGDLDGAVAAYREAVRHNPNDAAAHEDLGSALQEQGDTKGAIASLKEAVRLNPTYAAARTNLGAVLWETGDADGAIVELREAIRLDPKDATAHNNLGAVLCDGKQDYDGAIIAFKEAIRLDPKDADGHFNLGNALRHKGSAKDAIAAYRAAAGLDPKDARIHSVLAWLLATGPDGARDGKQAVEHAQRACELTGWKEPTYLDTLAAAHAEAGNFNRAAEFQDKALLFPAYERKSGERARERLQFYTQQKPYRDPALAQREAGPTRER